MKQLLFKKYHFNTIEKSALFQSEFYNKSTILNCNKTMEQDNSFQGKYLFLIVKVFFTTSIKSLLYISLVWRNNAVKN